MLLIKYILKEILKNQLIVLILLFLICFFQKLIKMLNLLLDNNVSTSLIFLCIGLYIPETGKLIVPCSLLISVLVTFYKFNLYNEIVAMYACAISKNILIGSVVLFSGIIFVFAFINISWLAPYCTRYQDELLLKLKEDANFSFLIEKKFQLLNDKDLTVFIENIQSKKIKNIFIVRNQIDELIEVMVAKEGEIHQEYDRSQLIILNKGTFYKIDNKKNRMNTDVYIANFNQYQLLLNQNCEILNRESERVSCMDIYKLWSSSRLEEQMELHWRLTLLASIFIMPIIALGFSINISCNYLITVLSTVVLYVIFVSVHMLLRFSINVETINFVLRIWLINIVYFMIAFFLNLRNLYFFKYGISKIFSYFYTKE